MNKALKIICTGAVAAVVAFFVLLLSGLGTTGLADAEGNWVSLTTVQLGTNEFGVLMILAVFVSVVAAGFAFNAMDKN
jgi:hypothetical protein